MLTFTSNVLAMMHVLVHYKSPYRSIESERLGLGTIDKSNEFIRALFLNKFIDIRSNGAIVPDKKAIQEFCALVPRSMLGEFRSKLENIAMTFPKE